MYIQRGKLEAHSNNKLFIQESQKFKKVQFIWKAEMISFSKLFNLEKLKVSSNFLEVKKATSNFFIQNFKSCHSNKLALNI